MVVMEFSGILVQPLMKYRPECIKIPNKLENPPQASSSSMHTSASRSSSQGIARAFLHPDADSK